MTLYPLAFPPGIYGQGTVYQGKGRWRDANLMRFLEGTVRPVGGWSALEMSFVPLETTLGIDTFSDSGGPDIALQDHVPDSGITAWEYGGVDNTWQVEVSAMQQRTYRANATGGFGSIARSTNNLTAGNAGIRVDANLHRAGVDGSGEVGLILHNNGSLAETVVDGLILTFQRSTASVVDARLYTFVNDVKIDDVSLPDLASLSWTSSPEEEKAVSLTYNHPTVTITVGAITTTAVVTQNMTGNGSRVGMYSDQYGSAGWRFLDLEYTALTAVEVSGTVRTLLGWTATGLASPLLAIGTEEGLWTFTAGVVTNRTPASGFTAGEPDSEVSVGNYGEGDYSDGVYGVGDTSQGTLVAASVWHLDTFGNYLVGVMSPADGHLWVWDLITAKATTIADFATNHSLSVTGSVPTGNLGVVVTEERFLVVLGAGGDPRKLQWPSQEGLVDWDPTTVGGTAGDYPISTTGTLMAGRRGKNETLIWTTEDLWRMQFIGGTLVYAVTQAGSKCGLIAPNACAVVDSRAAWMGKNGFFVYDGFVQPVPSEVSDAVFGDLNRTQQIKCFAVTRADLGEVWFHYPSASSQEPDKYVIWNYRENHWTPGELRRTGGIDRGAFTYPILAQESDLYEHESGFTRTAIASESVTPFLESGPLEVGTGDRVLDFTALVPDESTIAGQVLGSTRAYLYSAMSPTGTETRHGPYTMAQPTSVRVTGRQLRLRVEEVAAGDWRFGVLRADGQPGGRR